MLSRPLSSGLRSEDSSYDSDDVYDKDELESNISESDLLNSRDN
jgi:hypothetical protein